MSSYLGFSKQELKFSYALFSQQTHFLLIRTCTLRLLTWLSLLWRFWEHTKAMIDQNVHLIFCKFAWSQRIFWNYCYIQTLTSSLSWETSTKLNWKTSTKEQMGSRRHFWASPDTRKMSLVLGYCFDTGNNINTDMKKNYKKQEKKRRLRRIIFTNQCIPNYCF